MTSKDPEKSSAPERGEQGVNFDTRVLTRFVYALNIARQHTLSYPDDHPLVRKSSLALTGLLENLLEFRDSLTLGIARDSLLVEGSVLEERNPVFRKLAGELFDRGVAALTFRSGLQTGELLRFLRLAVERPEQLQERGGLPQVCREVGLDHIDVLGIDYRSLGVTEEESIGASDADLEEYKAASIWDRFVGGLVEGSLDPEGGETRTSNIDPRVVADYLSRKQQGGDDNFLASYEETITSFLRELDQEGRSHLHRTESMEKLGDFVSNLSPELRRQFLSSTFNTLERNEEIAEEVISHLSSDALFQALQDVNDKRLTIPPTVMNLLGKLSQHAEAPTGDHEQILSSAELGEHLRSLFREDDPDRYVPGTYQHLLHSIVSMEEIPPLEGPETEQIRQQLCGEQVEAKVLTILLDLMRQEKDSEAQQRLVGELMELLSYFIELGQFEVLLDLQRRLQRIDADGLPEQAANILTEKGLLNQILEVLSVWDKERFTSITALIRAIGDPFIEPMLDRLAVEPRRSVRRFLLDRLLEMGSRIREPALARLRDSRWFLVRNMLVLLQKLDDPVVLYAVRSMKRHPHPKVRLEVWRTLKQFGDPEADQILAEEICGGDTERRSWAMGQLRRPLSQPLRDALISLMETSDYGRDLLELKHRAVTELAALGDPAALPALERVLNDKSLLHLQGLARLKLAIVQSLERYPYKKVRPILELVAAGGGKTAEAARHIMQRKDVAQREKMGRLHRRRP
ncbi:MAG: HEAT repeat domain-containing protein [Geothermobacteraceae bacterium]